MAERNTVNFAMNPAVGGTPASETMKSDIAAASAANAAAFTPAAMKPVTGAGAPSYTSGTHMWNGTAATLKANPEASSAAEAKSRVEAEPPDRTAEATSAMRVDPLAPNASAAP